VFSQRADQLEIVSVTAIPSPGCAGRQTLLRVGNYSLRVEKLLHP
jgi:hypothetical protein